jgi:hypothetical protein
MMHRRSVLDRCGFLESLKENPRDIVQWYENSNSLKITKPRGVNSKFNPQPSTVTHPLPLPSRE